MQDSKIYMRNEARESNLSPQHHFADAHCQGRSLDIRTDIEDNGEEERRRLGAKMYGAFDIDRGVNRQ